MEAGRRVGLDRWRNSIRRACDRSSSRFGSRKSKRVTGNERTSDEVEMKKAKPLIKILTKDILAIRESNYET